MDTFWKYVRNILNTKGSKCNMLNIYHEILSRPQHEIYIGNYPVRFRENDVRKLFEEHGIEVSTIRLKHDGLKV